MFIVGCKRTAFGSFGGKLKDVGSVELGQIAARAAIQQSKLAPELIDSVVVGNIIQVNAHSLILHIHYIHNTPQFQFTLHTLSKHL